jgi:hypothetical protein
MIKKLLSIFAIALAVNVSAQSNRVVSGVFNVNVGPEISKSITYKTAALGCDTITTAQNNSLTINTAGTDTATPGCSPKAGYVFGSNCYQDMEKANFFPASTYSTISTPSIGGVLVAFYKSGTKGTGGAPTTTVGMVIYNPTSAAGGNPTSVVTATTAPMSLITVGASTTGICYFTYTLVPTAVSATNGFYASLVVPTTAGDTAVVFNSPSSTIDFGYERWSDLSWHSISSAWGATLKANLSIYPILCGNITTGISKSTLEKNVSLMPNPSTGLVNVLLNFGKAENVSVTVTNVIGQELISNKYDAITSFVAPLDLSSQANGIYFVTVSNGTEKMVQRLVINK